MGTFAAGKTHRTFVAKLFRAPFAGLAFRRLEEEGRLAELLPEVACLRQVTQPPEFHPEGDVLEHTFLMLDHMVFPDELLGWSVLLNDVGKAPARSVEPSGRIRFFGHEESGAEMAENILGRFGFSPEEREKIVHAVRNHMRFASVREMRRSKVESLLRDAHFPLELELHRLDCISCHGLMEGFDFLLETLVSLPAPEAPPLLTGKELLAAGFSPGRAMGEILKHLRELQNRGEIRTPQEALRRAEEFAQTSLNIISSKNERSEK